MKGATPPPRRQLPPYDVSIHAPNEGSDQHANDVHLHITQFQSTLPMKGATIEFSDWLLSEMFQSTLPMKGATLIQCLKLA